MKQRFAKPVKQRRQRGARQTLKHHSGKRRNRLEHYKRVRMEFLRSNRWCQVGMCLRTERDKATGVEQVFLNRATQVHHKRGRGRWLLDVDTFVGICPDCHRYLHEHPEWAMRQGFMESRRRR